MDSKNKSWKKELDKAIKYAESKGFRVVIKKPKRGKYSPIFFNEVDIQSKIIIICQDHCDEYKLYALLHELGHVNLRNNKTFDQESGYGQKFFSRSSLTYAISELEEEFEAWKIGQNIANRLKIKINKRKYHEFKSRCVATYVRHFSKGKKKMSSAIIEEEKIEEIDQEIEKSFENTTNYELFKQYFENKNLKIRNELLLRNQPLVTFIVNKYYSSNKISRETREELFQEGSIGLLSAIDGYDYRKGFKFSTYATWWVRQAVNNYLININPIIKVPSHIRSIQNKLMKKFNEENKNISEINDLNDDDRKELQISSKMLGSVKSAMKSKQVTSINKPIYNDGELTTLEDVLPSETSSFETEIDKDIMIKTVKEALKAMPEKRRLILLLRYDVLNKNLTTKGNQSNE